MCVMQLTLCNIFDVQIKFFKLTLHEAHGKTKTICKQEIVYHIFPRNTQQNFSKNFTGFMTVTVATFCW